MANPRVPKLSRATFCLIAETIRTIDFDSLADRDRVIANFTDALLGRRIPTSNQSVLRMPADRRARYAQIGGQRD